MIGIDLVMRHGHDRLGNPRSAWTGIWKGWSTVSERGRPATNRWNAGNQSADM